MLQFLDCPDKVPLNEEHSHPIFPIQLTNIKSKPPKLILIKPKPKFPKLRAIPNQVLHSTSIPIIHQPLPTTPSWHALSLPELSQLVVDDAGNLPPCPFELGLVLLVFGVGVGFGLGLEMVGCVMDVERLG